MKTWYQVDLIERGTERKFNLGAYLVADRETAQKRAETKHKNLLGKMETHSFGLDIYTTVDPGIALARAKRLKRKDAVVADIFAP